VKDPERHGQEVEHDDLVSFAERLVPPLVFLLVTVIVLASVFVTLLRRWRAS
jgi:hypothetical protein